MSDLFDFLKPISSEIISDIRENGFINEDKIHSLENQPEYSDSKIALFGVCEDRNSVNNKGCSNGPDVVRKALYSLNSIPKELDIVDLGNVVAGNEYADTDFAVKTISEELIKKGVIPLVIGGSQDITYSVYSGYEKLEQVINLVCIDAKIDLREDEDLDSENYLRNIVLHQPNYLFNFCNIGNQRPMVSAHQLELIEKMYFDHLRLGRLFDQVKETEPYLRNADLVSIDLSAIRRSDSPGSMNSGPNGLYADQVCQICKYAGMSDKLSSFGIFEYNPELDIRNQSAQLVAQMIWYFTDGVSNRKDDFPIGAKDDYLKFTVPLDREGYEIVFYKSPKTDRWWMDVPYPAGSKNRYERHHLVPCSYNDYQTATNDDIPDLWWKTFQKLV